MIDQTFYAALTTYLESGSEPFDGKVAVVHVIFNRCMFRRQSVQEVVFSSRQFEPFNNGKRPPINHYESFIDCQRAVQRAMDDRLRGFNFYDATIFMNVPVVIERYGHLPGWLTRGLDSGKVIRTAIIGGHTFFSETR